MEALKVIGLVFLFMMAWVVGFSMGISTDILADRDYEIDAGEGWLIRPVKHFLCGAFKGHKWQNDTPEAGGWKGLKCANCGKTKIVRCAGKRVSE